MDWRVRIAVNLMARQLEQPLSVTDLARRVNLSVSRFAHLFQRDVGRSPARYLRELRLDAARALAEESLLSVKEIMTRVGYSDPSHFTRDFARRHGAPPGKVRARARSPGSSRALPRGSAGDSAKKQQEPPTHAPPLWRVA